MALPAFIIVSQQTTLKSFFVSMSVRVYVWKYSKCHIAVWVFKKVMNLLNVLEVYI